jgi:putative glycerol-1-phosphate prenyltransferase
MGKQLVYLEAGSGAKNPVKASIIKKVASQLQIPIVVGGGIHSAKQLNEAYKNGANLVVIGTAFEENALLLKSQ